jgi:hypothetical protein
MKNKLIIFGTTISYLATAKFAFAEDTAINPCPEDGIGKILCGFTASNMGNVIGGLLNGVFVIAIIVALGYLIYGGVKWIISQGDKSKVQEARSHIIAAIIGLIIVFLSYFIITLIMQIFGLGNITDLKISPIKQ